MLQYTVQQILIALWAQVGGGRILSVRLLSLPVAPSLPRIGTRNSIKLDSLLHVGLLKFAATGAIMHVD